jgi:hypothetical protein
VTAVVFDRSALTLAFAKAAASSCFDTQCSTSRLESFRLNDLRSLGPYTRHSADMSVARTAFALARRGPLRAPIRRTFATTSLRSTLDHDLGQQLTKLSPPRQGLRVWLLICDTVNRGQQVRIEAQRQPGQAYSFRWYDTLLESPRRDNRRIDNLLQR